jgi:hypothetical protein
MRPGIPPRELCLDAILNTAHKGSTALQFLLSLPQTERDSDPEGCATALDYVGRMLACDLVDAQESLERCPRLIEGTGRRLPCIVLSISCLTRWSPF